MKKLNSFKSKIASTKAKIWWSALPKQMKGLTVAAIFAGVGVVSMFGANAEKIFIMIELDKGQLNQYAAIVKDSSAAAGQYIMFSRTAPKSTTTNGDKSTASGGSIPTSGGVQPNQNVSSGCGSGQVGTPPNCFPAPPAPSSAGKQWKIVYFEEFSGSTLNLSKLSPCFDWNYGGCTETFNNGRELYRASQVRVSGGTAKLVAEPLSPSEPSGNCYQGQCTYKAGLVSTARPRADNGSDYLFPFKYGYVESRMKFPGVPGFFTAFWMLPTNTTYDYQYEIDIVEILGGHPDTIFMTNHYNNRTDSYTPNNGLHNNGACPVKDYSGNWVRFGLDWQPTHIAWYINGVKCGQYAGSDIANTPMQLILHMMIDHTWQRDWNSTLSSLTLVNQLEVDYIRIYQQK